MTEQALQDTKRFHALKGIARPKTNLEISEEVERCRYMDDQKFATYVAVGKGIYARERSKIVERYERKNGETVEKTPTEGGVVMTLGLDGKPMTDERRKAIAKRAAEIVQQKRASGQHADFDFELSELLRLAQAVPVIPRDADGNRGEPTEQLVDGQPVARYRRPAAPAVARHSRPAVAVEKYGRYHAPALNIRTGEMG